MELSESLVQEQLDRRKPGQSALSTKRSESDRVRLVSGVQDGRTLGSPIAMLIDNKDVRARDYSEWQDVPRPSHADFTYRAKYGALAASGGGRASARETAARVAGGAVAEQYLRAFHGVDIVAWVSNVAGNRADEIDEKTVTRKAVDRNRVRCPDDGVAGIMEKAIEEARDAGDSVGGIVSCVCRNVPAGWGEPVFDKMDAILAAAMLSIPAAKGFEIGSGFGAVTMKGSEHNDLFIAKHRGGADIKIGTATNRGGGVQGGITNGEPVVFRVAFKPPPSISVEQKTVDYEGNAVTLRTQGRHDPCMVPRAVPVVEAMAALVLADMALRDKRLH